MYVDSGEIWQEWNDRTYYHTRVVYYITCQNKLQYCNDNMKRCREVSARVRREDSCYSNVNRED